MSQGRKPVSVTYWYSRKLNKILNSCPEWFPIPPILRDQGFEKVVCRTSRDVEIWSQKLRDQEAREAEILDLEREAIEAPQRARFRAELVYQHSHARNAFNKEFCRRALEKLDRLEARIRLKMQRGVSYQHCEGFEEKKH